MISFFKNKNTVNLCFYSSVILGSLLLIFSSDAALAVNTSSPTDLDTMTGKLVTVVKNNLLPIASLTGVGLGIWRSYVTGTMTPAAVCTAVGVGGIFLSGYVEKTYPFIL